MASPFEVHAEGPWILPGKKSCSLCCGLNPERCELQEVILATRDGVHDLPNPKPFSGSLPEKLALEASNDRKPVSLTRILERVQEGWIRGLCLLRAVCDRSRG